MNFTNVTLPAHRLSEGDEVVHAELGLDINETIVVDELTYRVAIEDGVLNAVPTYTLLIEESGELYDDIDEGVVKAI